MRLIGTPASSNRVAVVARSEWGEYRHRVRIEPPSTSS